MSPDARESMSEKERYESLCREPWPLVSTVEPQNTGHWSQHFVHFQRLSLLWRFLLILTRKVV